MGNFTEGLHLFPGNEWYAPTPGGGCRVVLAHGATPVIVTGGALEGAPIDGTPGGAPMLPGSCFGTAWRVVMIPWENA